MGREHLPVSGRFADECFDRLARQPVSADKFAPVERFRAERREEGLTLLRRAAPEQAARLVRGG